MTDVVVVGGGIIGCAIGRQLALDGMRTLVLERERPVEQASWAAAGMLSPLAESQGADAFLSLLLQSRDLYPALVEALRGETGVDVGYRGDGTLLLALTEADEEVLERRFRWQQASGLQVERLTREEVLELEPAVSRSVRGALRFAGDHQVDNRLLSRALWTAAEAAGASFRLGAEATRVLGSADGVRGVELKGGERIAAGTVVLAAGSWSGGIEGLPGRLPVEPVHGQLLALERTPPLFRHVVDSPRGYLVPRADGRMLVGATTERVGFRKAVTPTGVTALLGAALEIAPSLADAPILELWSGLRPDTPDHRPILGRDPRMPGLVYATGHYRNGILLTPVTALAVSGLVARGRSPYDVSAFSIERFGL